MAFKFGYLDLSARIIDLMRAAALTAEDPLLMAAVAYVRTETLFASGDLTSAARLLTRTAEETYRHPPAHLPAERRSHFYIELAAAQLNLGHHEDTYQCLAAARQVAPEHTREHPQVRQALAAFLRAYRSASTDLLDFAQWARLS